MYSEWLLFEPDIGYRFFHSQVKKVIWISHFSRSLNEITLEKLYWTPFTARRIHPMIEIPFGTKFFDTVSCFSELQVSQQGSSTFISCPPNKVHRVV